jgi:hypothetical protein
MAISDGKGEGMSESYGKLKRPPLTALRQIQGGDLKGKTDINPQWRYEAMDQVFGPCGDGWKYEIVRLWDYPTADGTVLCFAQVNVYTKSANGWSDPIPGLGGNTLVDMVKGYGQDDAKRAKPNDEGYKMAITDALSTALKLLGVAADIYRGNWDGTKYREDAPAKPAQKHIDPNAETLKAIMEAVRPNGTPWFTEAEKDAYRKKVKVYGITETLKQAEIALEEKQAAES